MAINPNITIAHAAESLPFVLICKVPRVGNAFAWLTKQGLYKVLICKNIAASEGRECDCLLYGHNKIPDTNDD